MSGPPVVHYCVSCRHPAHGGRVCGARTFFTRRCGCHLEKLIDELRRLDTRTSRETADALATRQREIDEVCMSCPPDDYVHTVGDHLRIESPDFDERKATREHDAEWYGDD